MDCSRPPVPYMDYFIPSILVAFAASSWGYLNLGISLNLDLRACNDGRIWSWCHAPLRISTVISPQNAMTATVMFILVGCGILGNPYKMLSCKMCLFFNSWETQPLCCQVSNNSWLHVSLQWQGSEDHEWPQSCLTLSYYHFGLLKSERYVKDDVIQGQRSPRWWCQRSDDPWHVTLGFVGAFDGRNWQTEGTLFTILLLVAL